MHKNYADTLESYIIPAEEGFGSTLIGTAAFITGIMLYGKISDLKKRNKLKKKIKANNGNPADYGDSTYNILKRYSKDITGVLEPANGNQYVKLWAELQKISNECENLRITFSRIDDPTTAESVAKYKKINSKIQNLQSKAETIIKKMKELDLTESSSNVVPLASSNIKKLEDIVWDAFNNLWRGGHDGWSLIMTDDYYFSEAGGVIKSEAVPEADNCVYDFDELVRTIEDDNDPDDYIRRYIMKCKFALDPNSKLK